MSPSSHRTRTRRRRKRHDRSRLNPAGPAEPRARTLHLVDADNLIGDPRTTDRALIVAVLEAYRSVAPYTVGDHVVIATGTDDPHVLAVELAWPQVAHRRRAGPDGADLVLLDHARWAAESRRFARVVLGSGDHIFVPAVERLLAARLSVGIVARAGSLSGALARCVGGRVDLLPADDAAPSTRAGSPPS